jgi:CyaY protein
MDAWLQEDRVDIDAHRSGGVLELTLPNASKVIVNLQAPLQEVWLAARSGGFHFRQVEGGWRDTKTGDEFIATLECCLSQQAGLDLRFER